MKEATIDSPTLAAYCARILEDKLASDIVILDLRASSSLADFFVVATAESSRQFRAIAESLSYILKKDRVPRGNTEGADSGAWLLVDLYDVIVHVFEKEAREFYDLEILWGEGPRLDWESIETPPVPVEVPTRSGRTASTIPFE